MAEVEWTKPPFAVAKHDLVRGISAWVKEKTGIENVHVSNLDRLNADDLELLAIGMGMKPNPERWAFIVQHWKRKAEQAEQQKKDWAARDLRREMLKTPHAFVVTTRPLFCDACGMIRAARVHDGQPVSVQPHPDSEAAFERDGGIDDIEGGLSRG